MQRNLIKSNEAIEKMGTSKSTFYRKAKILDLWCNNLDNKLRRYDGNEIDAYMQGGIEGLKEYRRRIDGYDEGLTKYDLVRFVAPDDDPKNPKKGLITPEQMARWLGTSDVDRVIDDAIDGKNPNAVLIMTAYDLADMTKDMTVDDVLKECKDKGNFKGHKAIFIASEEDNTKPMIREDGREVCFIHFRPYKLNLELRRK